MSLPASAAAGAARKDLALLSVSTPFFEELIDQRIRVRLPMHILSQGCRAQAQAGG